MAQVTNPPQLFDCQNGSLSLPAWRNLSMADKKSGSTQPVSLRRSQLAVRYSQYICPREPGSRQALPVGRAVDAKAGKAMSPPTLQSFVQPSLRTDIKELLGPYQSRIRNLQSPAWLFKAQHHGERNGRQACREAIDANNLLLDICRSLEIVLNELTASSALADFERQHNGRFGQKLSGIWEELYLAVDQFNIDSDRSCARVRRARLELTDLIAELADVASFPGTSRSLVQDAAIDRDEPVARTERPASQSHASYRRLQSRLAMIAAEINRAIGSLSRLSGPALKTPKGGATKKVVLAGTQGSGPAMLSKQIQSLQLAVQDLAGMLDQSNSQEYEIIGILKQCAARLGATASSAYAPKRWELELHRARHIFMQAAVQLELIYPAPGQGDLPRSRNAEHIKIAEWINVSFASVVDSVLEVVDRGHVRRSSGAIKRQQLQQKAAGGVLSGTRSPQVAAVFSGPAYRGIKNAARGGRADPDTPPASGNQATPSVPVSVQQAASASKPAYPVGERGKPINKARKMSDHWQELEKLARHPRPGSSQA